MVWPVVDMGNSSGRIVPMLDLRFEKQSGVNLDEKVDETKTKDSQFPSSMFWSELMADRVFFARSFRRTKIHMETRTIVGFKKKPLPWGSILNFTILWVLLFKSRTLFKFLGNDLMSDTFVIH